MKKGDIILFASIIAICLCLVVGMFVFVPAGKTVIIKQDNRIYGEYPLEKNTEIILEHNTITIENGKAFVSYADCPDKVCFKNAPINKRGETIICLPNKVIIQIQ
ncbi:MAG: NusG domain II-containing protein [Clostridia bacterium]|nr:NusG domain II-containing protein [Clostridia bacterium]